MRNKRKGYPTGDGSRLEAGRARALRVRPQSTCVFRVRPDGTGLERLTDRIRTGIDLVSRCSAEGLKRAVVGVHDSEFQQIQGGQQIGILD